MRKAVCACLCTALLCGCGHIDKTYPSGVSLMEYEEKYSEAVAALIEQDGQSFVDAFMLDVDNDKEPELLELIQKEEGIGSRVYAYYDKLMVRVDEFEDCVFDFGERKSLPWTGLDGMQYFYKTISSGDEAMNELYYFDGGIRREVVHTCEALAEQWYIDSDEVSVQMYKEHIKSCPTNTDIVKKQTFVIDKNKDKGKKLKKYWN